MGGRVGGIIGRGGGSPRGGSGPRPASAERADNQRAIAGTRYTTSISTEIATATFVMLPNISFCTPRAVQQVDLLGQERVRAEHVLARPEVRRVAGPRVDRSARAPPRDVAARARGERHERGVPVARRARERRDGVGPEQQRRGADHDRRGVDRGDRPPPRRLFFGLAVHEPIERAQQAKLDLALRGADRILAERHVDQPRGLRRDAEVAPLEAAADDARARADELAPAREHGLAKRVLNGRVRQRRGQRALADFGDDEVLHGVPFTRAGGS